MVASSSEYMDWRTRFPAYGGDTGADPNGPINWWDFMRKRSWEAQHAINTMPRVYDAPKFYGMSTDQQGSVLMPGTRSFSGGMPSGVPGYFGNPGGPVPPFGGTTSNSPLAAAAAPSTAAPAAAAPAVDATAAAPAPLPAAPGASADAGAISPGMLSAMMGGVSGAERLAGFGGGAAPAPQANIPFNPPPNPSGLNAGLLGMLQADPGQIGYDPTTLMAMLKGGQR